MIDILLLPMVVVILFPFRVIIPPTLFPTVNPSPSIPPEKLLARRSFSEHDLTTILIPTRFECEYKMFQ